VCIIGLTGDFLTDLYVRPFEIARLSQKRIRADESGSGTD